MANAKKAFDQLTKEDYKKALEEIQEQLSDCVGDLIILGGYLDSDHLADPENTEYVLMAARDIVQVACKSVKIALGYTYPMV